MGSPYPAEIEAVSGKLDGIAFRGPWTYQDLEVIITGNRGEYHRLRPLGTCPPVSEGDRLLLVFHRDPAGKATYRFRPADARLLVLLAPMPETVPAGESDFADEEEEIDVETILTPTALRYYDRITD